MSEVPERKEVIVTAIAATADPEAGGLAAIAEENRGLLNALACGSVPATG